MTLSCDLWLYPEFPALRGISFLCPKFLELELLGQILSSALPRNVIAPYVADQNPQRQSQPNACDYLQVSSLADPKRFFGMKTVAWNPYTNLTTDARLSCWRHEEFTRRRSCHPALVILIARPLCNVFATGLWASARTGRSPTGSYRG